MTAALQLEDSEPVLRPALALRTYQRAAIDAAYTWCHAHEGNPLLVVPTGGGKSLIMGTMGAEAVAGGARVVVIAHRKELIEQNWKALQQAGLRALDVGLISGQHGRKDHHTRATVASIQTLARNPFQYGPYDLVLIDECHLLPRNDDSSYRKVLDAFRTRNPALRCIGLTATPYRLDSGRLDQGEGRFFHDVAYEITIGELLDGGYLAPLISKATLARYDVTGVAMRGGEYVPEALQSAVDDPETTRQVIAELATLAGDRKKWLVFCVGVQHAEHMAEALTAAGYPAAAVHGNLTAHERSARLAALRSGHLRALTNCDVLTTGYDEPSIDCLALCRPTASTGLHVQMIGRGFRTAPGKTDCLVLDFAGNCLRHGPIDAVRVRDPKKKGTQEAPAKECPDCHEIVGTATRLCPRCGFAFPPPKPAQLAPVAMAVPVLSTERSPARWTDVTRVTYAKHVSKDPEKKTPTLRVDYFYHFGFVVSEYICIEHRGFAHEKACTWWADHLGGPMPTTVDEALERAGALEVPVAIALERDGRYERVVNWRYVDEPKAPTSAAQNCVFCLHFDDLLRTCNKWHETPPADVLAVGCDAFESFDDAPLPF